MSVQTAAPIARNDSRMPLGRGTGATLLALLVLPFTFRRSVRSKLNGLLTVVLLLGGLAGVAGLTGCGSGTNGFLQQLRFGPLHLPVVPGAIWQLGERDLRSNVEPVRDAQLLCAGYGHELQRDTTERPGDPDS
jgi:hypothetical protein